MLSQPAPRTIADRPLFPQVCHFADHKRCLHLIALLCGSYMSLPVFCSTCCIVFHVACSSKLICGGVCSVTHHHARAAACEAHLLLARAHVILSNAPSEATMVVVQCRSRQMFDSHSIQTIFKAAGLSVTVRETQRAGHATEIVRSLQLDQCDALVTVGGDGTVFEALQVMPRCAHMTTDMQILPTCTTLHTWIKVTHKLHAF